MINVTKLYCGLSSASDPLRYGRRPRSPQEPPSHGSPHDAPRSARERRPIVVWTMGRRCNLHCVHCYSDSENRDYPGELTVEEARRMLTRLTCAWQP